MDNNTTERRASERLNIDLPGEVQKLKTGELYPIRFQNISKHGAYFLSTQRVDIGESVQIRLGTGFFLEGTVVRAEQAFEKMFGFAIKFSQPQDRPGHERQASFDVDSGTSLVEAYQLEIRQLNERAFEYYEQLDRVRQFVRQNFQEDIKLETVAQIAAMERTYFSFFFRQKLGVTFSAWLQYYRILKALDLIKSKDRSITDVAFSVGFNELSTFQKAFKRWTNLTPRDFKRLAKPA